MHCGYRDHEQSYYAEAEAEREQRERRELVAEMARAPRTGKTLRDCPWEGCDVQVLELTLLEHEAHYAAHERGRI